MVYPVLYINGRYRDKESDRRKTPPQPYHRWEKLDHRPYRNYAVADSDQGRARRLIENEMIPRGEAGIEQYGGQRNAIRLNNVPDAIEFLNKHDGNVPFNIDS